MGRTVTPTYRVVFASRRVGDGARFTDQQAWRGRASEARLVAFADSLEASTSPVGVNANLGEHVVMSAELVHQKTGAVVCAWKRPAFSTVAP